jgi:ribose transport system permease protein
MLPFAAILAIAAVGQTLVVQQGGLDLSAPGMISLSAALVTKAPGHDSGKLLPVLALIGAVAVATGLLTGVAVARFGITPLVATLGVNALLVGTVLQVTGGSIANEAPANLTTFAGGTVLGVPNTALVALALVTAAALVLRRTLFGRRFEAVGANPRAAHAAGIPVARHLIGGFVGASSCYAIAGVLLAGFIRAPSLQSGDTYLLPMIAAVVLGGTSLAGGRGSVVASAAGAVFLSQLDRVVIALGANDAVQNLTYGAIIALGMGLRNLRIAGARHQLARLGGRSSRGRPEPGNAAPPSSPEAYGAPIGGPAPTREWVNHEEELQSHDLH